MSVPRNAHNTWVLSYLTVNTVAFAPPEGGLYTALTLILSVKSLQADFFRGK